MPGTPSPVWKKEVSGQGAEPAGSAPGTGAGQRTVGPGAGLVGGGPIAPGSHGGLVGGNSHHGHGAAGNVPGSTQPFKRSNDGFFRADDGAFRMVSMPPGFQKAASVPLARPQAASWSRAKGETRRVRRCKDCGCAECKGAQNGNSCEASEEQRRQWNKGNGNKKLTRPSRSKLATCVCCKVACWEKPRKHAANMRGKRTRLSAGPTAAGAPKARSDVPMFTHTSTPSQFHFGGPNSHFTGANGQSREAALLSGYGFNHAGPMGHSSMVLQNPLQGTPSAAQLYLSLMQQQQQQQQQQQHQQHQQHHHPQHQQPQQQQEQHHQQFYNHHQQQEQYKAQPASNLAQQQQQQYSGQQQSSHGQSQNADQPHGQHQSQYMGYGQNSFNGSNYSVPSGYLSNPQSYQQPTQMGMSGIGSFSGAPGHLQQYPSFPQQWHLPMQGSGFGSQNQNLPSQQHHQFLPQQPPMDRPEQQDALPRQSMKSIHDSQQAQQPQFGHSMAPVLSHAGGFDPQQQYAPAQSQARDGNYSHFLQSGDGAAGSARAPQMNVMPSSRRNEDESTTRARSLSRDGQGH